MDTTMAPARLQAFLPQPLHACVSSLRNTGSPFSAPLDGIYENGSVFLTAGGRRPVITRLRRDPRICVCAFAQEFPPSYAITEGRVQSIDDHGHAIRLRIGRKYMTRVRGLDLALFERNWLAEARTVFRMAAENCLSTDGQLITNLERDGAVRPVELRERG